MVNYKLFLKGSDSGGGDEGEEFKWSQKGWW